MLSAPFLYFPGHNWLSTLLFLHINGIPPPDHGRDPPADLLRPAARVDDRRTSDTAKNLQIALALALKRLGAVLLLTLVEHIRRSIKIDDHIGRRAKQPHSPAL